MSCQMVQRPLYVHIVARNSSVFIQQSCRRVVLRRSEALSLSSKAKAGRHGLWECLDSIMCDI